MSIFVGRKKTIASFNHLAYRDGREWLLLLDGVEGIGKTAVLSHLAKLNQNDLQKRFITLNLNSTELSQDPLILLDKIAAGLPQTSFQEYTTHLLGAYNHLQNAHITAENIITVDKGEIFSGDLIMTTPEQYEIRGGTESDVILKNIFIQSHIILNVTGTIHNQKIQLSAVVDLKQALQDLRRHMRHELSIRFRQTLLDYFNTHYEEQLFICLDNMEQLQKTVLSQETADWLLNSLLAIKKQQQ